MFEFHLPLILTISSPTTLEAAGFIALVDLPAVTQRTALVGVACFLDVLVLVPGIHKQQCADEINRGEFPTTGAMTSGYVFRVENPATVSYLLARPDTLSRPGCPKITVFRHKILLRAKLFAKG